MKIKNISIIILFIGLIVCVSAYIKKDMDYSDLETKIVQLTSTNQDVNTVETLEPADIVEDPIEGQSTEKESVIRPEQFNEAKVSEYTLIDEYEIDINDDTTLEYIALYAMVEVMDGDYYWDDGQKWLLLVRDNEQSYVIFDDYIQLGDIEAYVYEDLTENNVHITTFLKQSAGISINDYIFNKNEKVFYEKDVFYVGNINNSGSLKLKENLFD